MKTLRGIYVIVLVGLLSLVGAKAQAQVSPSVSAKYSVAQIDEMYRNHKMSGPQNTFPSQELNAKFMKDFPNARDIEWEKTEYLYEVEFEIGRIASKDFKVYYDTSGQLLMYEEEISTRDIPTVVKNGALAKYPNFRIEDACKIVKGKETFYEVELEKGDLEVKLTLNSMGSIISEIVD